MFSTMLGQSSLCQLVTLLLEHSPQCLLFTEANFGFPAWCHFRWMQLVLGWMAAALWAVFQGKAAHRLVSELRSYGVASFFSFPLSKLCPASEFQGLGENTSRHQRLSFAHACMNQNLLLSNERTAKRSETGCWTHLSETSVRKAYITFHCSTIQLFFPFGHRQLDLLNLI